MTPEILALGERAHKALEQWQSAYATLMGVGISPDATSGYTPGASVSDVNARTVASLAALAGLQGATSERLVLLAPKAQSLVSVLETFERQSQALIESLLPWQGSTAADRNGNLLLQLQHPEKGAQNVDVGSPLSAISQQANALLDLLPLLSRIAGDSSIPLFSGVARAAEQHLADALAAASAAASTTSKGVTLLKQLETLHESSTHINKQVQDLLAATAEQRAAVDNNAAEVTQKLALVREVSKDADTLQQRVTSFSAQFQAFDEQMKNRLQQFSDFEAATKEAARLSSERDKRIDDLSDRADTMIRGATTAGLSKSLEDTKDLYEKRLEQTQKYFLLSVGFLLLSALPIAAQLVPGPWQQWFAPAAQVAANSSSPWLAALGKLILVIPGTWATAFFASNYAELFHLSREYAHKAALAKAIDGFKREAPSYEEEIVGSVFMEIQDNPGSRKAPSAATPQNPVTRKFFELVIDAIKAKKAGA
jgi:hypothetical protein